MRVELGVDAIDPHHPLLHGHLDPVADPQHLRRPPEALGSPEHRPDPSGQLLGHERLRDVVVGPSLQPGDDVEAVRSCGHHDDRHVAPSPQATAHLEAVEIRQHHVEEYAVSGPPLERRQPRFARRSLVDIVALIAEEDRRLLADARIVFDQKDPSRHSSHHARPGSSSSP